MTIRRPPGVRRFSQDLEGWAFTARGALCTRCSGLRGDGGRRIAGRKSLRANIRGSPEPEDMPRSRED